MNCERATKQYPQGRTGTDAGYFAHRRGREPENPCNPCRLAHNKYQAPINSEYLSESRPANKAANLPRALEFMGVDYECVECRATDDLHFDHVDPATKEYNISGLLRLLWSERLESELVKCQLLCSRCHAIKTNAER